MSMLNRLSTIGGVDPLPTALGPTIKLPAVSPAAGEPKRIAPGLMRGPDGKLYTDLPVPPKLAPQQPEPPLNAPGAGEVFSLTNPTAGVRPATEPGSKEYVRTVRTIRTRRGDTWEPGSPGLYPGDQLTAEELEVVSWTLSHRQLVACHKPGIFPYTLLLRVEVGDTVPLGVVQDGLVWPASGRYASITDAPYLAKRIA